MVFIDTVDDTVDVAHGADVIAAAAEAIRRSGAHAVEQFSDFAEISTALGDQEASDLWAELADTAKQMLRGSAR
jgi:hypothetical protein